MDAQTFMIKLKVPPLPPPSPLLLILSKGARFELLLVEVLQLVISPMIEVSPPDYDGSRRIAEVLVIRWRYQKNYKQ